MSLHRKYTNTIDEILQTSWVYNPCWWRYDKHPMYIYMYILFDISIYIYIIWYVYIYIHNEFIIVYVVLSQNGLVCKFMYILSPCICKHMPVVWCHCRWNHWCYGHKRLLVRFATYRWCSHWNTHLLVIFFDYQRVIFIESVVIQWRISIFHHMFCCWLNPKLNHV